MSQRGARFNFSCLVSRLPCVYNRAVQCNATLSTMDDVVESPDPASTSSVSPLECTYSITVYAGYGVEIQVKCFISFSSFTATKSFLQDYRFSLWQQMHKHHTVSQHTN